MDKVEDTQITVIIEVEASVSSYEAYAKSQKTGQYKVGCSKNWGGCEFRNLRPGVNYTITVVHCYGGHPIHCLLKARPVLVKTRPPRMCFFVIRPLRE